MNSDEDPRQCNSNRFVSDSNHSNHFERNLKLSIRPATFDRFFESSEFRVIVILD